MTETTKTHLEVPRTASRETTSRGTSRQSTSSRKGLSSRRKSTGGGRRGSFQSTDDEDSASEALGEHGFPKYVEVQVQTFVYSDEVRSALDKLRERRARRNKFKKNEVHIFHLPKIMNSGTLPFVPSATFVRSTEEAALPEPKAVPKLPRIRRTRQRTLLIDQTLEDVLEEEGSRRVRRQTPMSRSFTKSFSKTPRTTPKSTPRTTPRTSQSPKLTTPRMTPKSTPR